MCGLDRCAELRVGVPYRNVNINRTRRSYRQRLCLASGTVVGRNLGSCVRPQRSRWRADGVDNGRVQLEHPVWSPTAPQPSPCSERVDIRRLSQRLTLALVCDMASPL